MLLLTICELVTGLLSESAVLLPPVEMVHHAQDPRA